MCIPNGNLLWKYWNMEEIGEIFHACPVDKRKTGGENYASQTKNLNWERKMKL